MAIKGIGAVLLGSWGAGDELGCPDSNVHRPTGIASDVSTGPCISCLEEADCRLRVGTRGEGTFFVEDVAYAVTARIDRSRDDPAERGRSVFEITLKSRKRYDKSCSHGNCIG